METYRITYQELLLDLHQAYLDARRHKRNKPYQQLFEARLEHNLTELCDELWTRTYKPRPSVCFLIEDPKRREVFAADFRDRIVHHLYYNYVHEMLERTFIQDSYSCIKGRGTHYGINRLEQHIRRESQNYRERCYVLKLDIRGYFMHINRQRLLNITLASLNKMAVHRIHADSRELWCERVDMDFVCYLTREIILLDPTCDCLRHGRLEDWDDLPREKSLFNSPRGCGLPIGNLTSQLFSNVYMNVFDQWMKRQQGCRHYGRYVDDAFVVSGNREWLRGLAARVRLFLKDVLGLTLHEGKLQLCRVSMGVEFLGAYLKPYRRYVSNQCLRRMKKKVRTVWQMMHCGMFSFERLRASLNSFLGVLSHYRSYALGIRLMCIDNDFSPWCVVSVLPPRCARCSSTPDS